MSSDKNRAVMRGTAPSELRDATKESRRLQEHLAGEAKATVPRDEKIAVSFILFLFVVLATTYGIVTPIFEGFDENWHFAFVQYIANGKGLPRQPAEQFPHLAKQEASQPPLYYALAAALTFWVPNNDDKIYERYNPQFQPIPWDYRDNKNIIVHTDAESFPWRGTPLAVHLARFLSVAFGAGTVYSTYLLTRSLFPNQPALALGAMLLNALTPSFIFMSALVNNDVLIVFLSSVTLIFIANEAKQSLSSNAETNRPRNPRRLIRMSMIGVLLALAALTKLSGLGLNVFAAVVFILIALRTRNYRTLLIRGTIGAIAFLLVASWWYFRNTSLYGDPTGLNMMLDIMGRREPGFGPADLIPELEGIRRSYWALFGQTNVVPSDWFYYTFDFLSLGACIGLLVLIYRAWRARRWGEISLLLFLALWFAIIAAGLTRWALTTAGSQGRLLYPAIGVASILLARGWIEIAPRRVSALVVAALVAVAIYIPFFVITPAYAQPEQLRHDQIVGFISKPLAVDVKFGSVKLLGYRIGEEAKAGEVVWVDACWSSEERISEDDLAFVQLLEANDLIAAQKDSYHGEGTYPTSQWKPGTVFCDRYPLRVRDTAPAASRSEIAIGLYHANGERVEARVDGKAVGDNFRFAGPAIVPTRFDYEWGKRVALDNYKLDRTALQAGQSLKVTLMWRAMSDFNRTDVATVQVMDSNGKIIGQNDSPVKLGTDERIIPISPYSEPGVYEVKLGVYQPAPIENLPLYHDGRRAQGSDLVSLWWIRINP